MSQTTNNQAQKDALRTAIASLQSQVGTMSNQVNALAELEAKAALAGVATSHQVHKDALIQSCGVLLDQAQLLHKQLCALP